MMAEYRVHWEENGVIKYSWHRTHNQAGDSLSMIRKQLGASELSEDRNVVRFDLRTATKDALLDFLNEHVADGGPCSCLGARHQ